MDATKLTAMKTQLQALMMTAHDEGAKNALKSLHQTLLSVNTSKVPDILPGIEFVTQLVAKMVKSFDKEESNGLDR